MDQTDQTDFSDLQKEERFQNLAKSLKVTRLKTNAKSQIPWSSCSSINGDPSDANYTLTSQFSKAGSEILTSSRNLKNLIHKRSCYSPMATSSVKRFCVNEKNLHDKEIMPPPSSCGMRTPLKRVAPVDSAQERNKFARQSTHDNDHFSEENKQLHFDINSSKDFSEGHAGPESQKEKINDRHFHRWRVFLNDRGELLIKGLLNNEIWARSKPVAEILSPTKLKSKYQHTYYLNGNIYDEKNELPKYIYQKFYNGFPDDWRNVHAIWKNYVAQGSGENFRWPMDVNYSDDDLNSEITDITQVQKAEKKFQELSSMEKSTPQRSSGYSSDFPHERETTKIADKVRKNQSMGNNFTVTAEQFSEKENMNLHESRNQTNMTIDTSCSGKLYTALNYALSLKDIIFENKLTFITQNLLHEKCPKEYVQCVSRTIRDLNNILSVKIGDQDENTLKKFMDNLHTKDSETFAPSSCLAQDDDYTSQIDECEKISEKITKNNSNDINEKLMRQIITNKIAHENEGLVSKNINDKLEKNAKTNNPETDSESEIYAGVPKISEKILESKIYHKRQRRMDSNGKSRARNINKESKNELLYDSSVSILEDEFQKNIISDNERIVARSDSKNLKTIQNHSKSNADEFIKERRADPLRENHVIDNNKNSSKIPIPSKLTNAINNDHKKSTVNKENIENDNDIFQRKVINDYPDAMQKPIITNTEIVNFHNFKKPQHSTSEQNQQVLKQSQVREKQEEKIVEIPKNSSQDTFGSEENPKILTNWIPLVTFIDNKCQLVFEGTLLNSVGQLMKKKLTTSQVIKRISTSTIETADHQFFKLLGEISVKKHVVPKELLPHCRTGCPVNIDQFCSTWFNLKGENNLATERAQKSDDDKKYVPISSRGRNIRPPMNFWTGERLRKKDGDTVYVSGDPKEKFLTSTNDSPNKCRRSSEHVTTNETAKGVLHSTERRHAKNKVAQKLKFVSSESEEEQKDKATNKHKSHLYALRKRQKISYEDYDEDENENYPIVQKETEKPKQVQRGRNFGPMIHLTYEKRTGKEDITLSDDQISVI